MNRSMTGPLVTGLIVVGVVAILAFNIQPGGSRPVPTIDPPVKIIEAASGDLSDPDREHPIGDPEIRNQVQVTAVWLGGVTMDGMTSHPSAGSDIIHLEADIKATENNPNGFAKDEFVPYLKLTYAIVPASGGSAVDKGALLPMIAGDGLHYGANISRPKSGDYKLIFDIEPPSAGGLGRHVGKGGVAAWWKPFRAEFDWTIEPTAPPAALAGGR